MACTKNTVKSSGLNIWSSEAADGPAPVVDIIAVQGLGSHEFYTWVKKVTKEESKKSSWAQMRKDDNQPGQHNDGEHGPREVMWPRDLLVPMFKEARVATYSYKSDWKDRHVKTSLRECAEQFLNILQQHRRHANERQRPLVLIGHSLGSLVIQQALVIAVHQQEFHDLRLSVAGIIFVGAPFQGSDAAIFGEWLARLSWLDSTLLQALKKGSRELYELATDFHGSYGDWDLVCFYEKKDTSFGGVLKAQVVNPQSASLLGKRKIFLTTDHTGLNKFSGVDDENFALILPEIRRMVEGGPSIVAERHFAKDVGSTCHGNVHWMVPRTINNLFTGRGNLLLRIQKAIYCENTSPPDKQKRFVITGLGGQGKSEICLQVASQMREEFWGVFWVDVGKPTTAERDFITIAKLLGYFVESLCDALQVLASTKQAWLLILDNADDPNFDYQIYFPSGNQGAVLMTSRVSECKQYSPDAIEALEGLKEEDSRELLLKAADVPKESWSSYYDQAEKVVSLLGSHTLALIQAGAYIAKDHCQLHQYPEVYQRQRKRLLQFRPKQGQSRYHDVYATFEASAEVLAQSQSEATEDALCLLATLSILDSAVLPLQIFQSAWGGSRQVLKTSHEETNRIDAMSRSHALRLPGFLNTESDEWDTFRLSAARSQLLSLSLVIQHDLEGSIGLSMHPLTHAWAKDRQDPEQQDLAWIATGCVLALSQPNSIMWQTQERLLLPHIQSYLDIKIRRLLQFGSEAIVVPILFNCGWTLLNMRQDSRLSRLLEDMFTELSQNPKEPVTESLPLYDLQARSLVNIGMNEEAVALLERVVKIQETTQAQTHPSRLASQHVLAGACLANGQVEEAVALLERVVKIEETTQAQTHPSRLASQHVLAGACLANGQVEEAVALLERVVKIEETTLAQTHPSRLASQHALARAYLANGQVEEAVALLERVVKIEETTLAQTHPSRLASQHALARAYLANGQVEEAVALLERVVKIQETTLAQTHPSRLASQHVLARAYLANGQVEEAVAARILSNGHPTRQPTT